MGKEYKIEFFPEICCEECGEIIHNHFDCPYCGKKYAGTSISCSVYEYFADDDTFYCDNCGTKFKLLSEADYAEDVKIIIVKEGKKK